MQSTEELILVVLRPRTLEQEEVLGQKGQLISPDLVLQSEDHCSAKNGNLFGCEPTKSGPPVPGAGDPSKSQVYPLVMRSPDRLRRGAGGGDGDGDGDGPRERVRSCSGFASGEALVCLSPGWKIVSLCSALR